MEVSSHDEPAHPCCGATDAGPDQFSLTPWEQLLSVRNWITEFRERRGFGSSRRVQIEREEVVRLEFDTRRDKSDPPSGRAFGMRERAEIVKSANGPAHGR
jgi:hypothetical protein